LHPEVTLRVHRAHLQLAYDGSIWVQTKATLIGRQGQALPYGHHFYHRISPSAWWDGTPRHHLAAAVRAHYHDLGLAPPAPLQGPGAIPLHLHPEGHPFHPRTGPDTAPAGLHQGFDPSAHWHLKDIALQWEYGGHLHVALHSILATPDGTLHPSYSSAHDHYHPLEQWWEQPTRLLILDALQAQHAHWSLDAPPLEHLPMHLHPVAHPYQEHVMPDGPTAHPDLPALDAGTRDWVLRHQIAAKEAESNGAATRPPGAPLLSIHPSTHPLHPDYIPPHKKVVPAS
jgi:hypothetical protein